MTGTPNEDGTRTAPVVSLDVLDLYDAWTFRHEGALDAIRERLDDVDLEPHVDEWLKALTAGELRESDTPERYRVHIRTLMPEGKRFPRSRLTYRTIVQWLAGLKVSDPTRRKYRAALSSFCRHLVKAEVLATNPVATVEAPKASAPRQRYLAMHDIHQARGSSGRALPNALRPHARHGHGVSAALRVKRADIDPLTRKVRAHGTKTHARDREVYVDSWAWSYVERAMKHLTPGAPLFPSVDRWSASEAHRAACKELGEDFADYRMHDARHSYAVRAIKAGASLEHVARQLGHADTQMVVKVYGRYKPSETERREWERIAELQDAERERAAQA